MGEKRAKVCINSDEIVFFERICDGCDGCIVRVRKYVRM
jgi:hypothetical protein